MTSSTLSRKVLPTGRRRKVLGMLIDELDYESLIEQVRQWAATPVAHYVCISNVHMVMEAYDDAEFRTVVNKADLIAADGVPVIWAARALGLHKQRRVFSSEITIRLCEMAEREEIPVGFYGSTPEIAQALLRNVRRQFPALKVPFCYSPPFRSLRAEEDEEIITQINQSGIRILFVGLGCPKQERWMFEHRGRLAATMLGVGWAFAILAGTSKTAPVWVQKIGMEWFHRLLKNPKRMWRRYLKHNPRFVVYILWQLFHRGRHSAPLR